MSPWLSLLVMVGITAFLMFLLFYVIIPGVPP